LEYYGITDIGKIRKENQDCFLVRNYPDSKILVAVVCDGMGGAKAGGLASSVASKSFMDFVEDKLNNSSSKTPSYKNILTNACAESNGIVYQYSCFDSEYSGMGTTLVGALCLKNKAYVVNIGDSRAYLISKKKISQITTDHSLVEEMVQRGEITRSEARNHPQKNIITNALGIEGEIRSDVFEVKIQKGDRLFLCSDGISNLMSDELLLEESKKYDNPKEFCQAVIEFSLALGSPDNITAVAIQI